MIAQTLVISRAERATPSTAELADLAQAAREYHDAWTLALELRAEAAEASWQAEQRADSAHRRYETARSDLLGALER